MESCTRKPDEFNASTLQKDHELFEREKMILKLESENVELTRQAELLRKGLNQSQGKLISDLQKRLFSIQCKLGKIMGESMVILTNNSSMFVLIPIQMIVLLTRILTHLDLFVIILSRK